MRNFLKSTRFKVLLVFFVLIVAIILRAAAEGSFGSFAAKAIGTVTSPLLKVSSGFSEKITVFFDKLANVDVAYELNDIYREKINDLNNRLIDYENIKRENEQYKQYLDIKARNSDFVFMPAQVIAKDPNDRFGSFVINCGELDGISLNDPVITSEGIVGLISAVGSTYSSVTTIFDPGIKLGCYDVETADYGICQGSIDHAVREQCRFIYLPRESLIKVGDLVVSSGGGIFPKDLVIGNVVSVSPDEHGVSLSASIQVSADINNVMNVFVITDFEGQGSVLSAEGLNVIGNYGDSHEQKK